MRADNLADPKRLCRILSARLNAQEAKSLIAYIARGVKRVAH
jgi:hypothetical protein